MSRVARLDEGNQACLPGNDGGLSLLEHRCQLLEILIDNRGEFMQQQDGETAPHRHSGSIAMTPPRRLHGTRDRQLHQLGPYAMVHLGEETPIHLDQNPSVHDSSQSQRTPRQSV